MPCKNHPSVEGPLWQCSRCGNPFCVDCIVQIGGQTYCADCKAEAMRDLRSGVPVHQLELASIGQRFVALFLDGIILGLPIGLVIAAIVFGVMASASSGETPEELIGGVIVAVQFGVTFLMMGIWILYEGTMLSRGGQTLGKKIMKLKVVTPEGNDLTRGQAYGRAAIRQLISLFCAIIDYAPAFGQDRTCIHDMAAKTRVVTWNG
ncbi:MAG TPA: RDD family protein [Thermoanaerobaculia bacterium]|nr:RDD family protein [Thermoanaerobaculia bacterium]